jgi:response regulator of citrate/malate metabolism
MTLKVLIVEDEPTVAMDLEQIAQRSGHEVVGVARWASDAQALSYLEPELALVDINLKDGPTGPHISSKLARQDVTVVLVTANLKQIPLDFCGAIGAVAKPFTDHAIRDVIAYAASLRSHGDTADMPSCIIPANAGPIWRHPGYPRNLH